MANKNLTQSNPECPEVDHPYSRWATITGITKTMSAPTPEQRALSEKINAQRAAAQGDSKTRTRG